MRLVNIDAINGTFAPNEQYTGREVMALLAQQPAGWIPVTERLPEEHESQNDIFDLWSMAVTDTEYHMVSDLVQVTVMDPEKSDLFVCDDCTCDGKWSNYEGYFDVVAWMPLPEPYRPAL